MKRKGASEKDHEATTKKEVDCAAKDIDDKFDMLFREVGLDIKEHAICKRWCLWLNLYWHSLP